ncbi:MAG: cell wall hydrolase, partial [Lachnospiraceae bacterium]|nr:cell wall hydrolase [Lachnospiraceae bacterium]
GPEVISADSKQTQQAIDNANEQKGQTQDAIDENQGTIDSLNHQQDSLEGQLGNLNTQLTQVSDNLADIEKQVSDKNDEISTTSAELDDATAQADEQYASMKKRIQFMYECGDSYFLETLLKSGSFAEMLNRAGYINEISAYDRKMLTQYKDTMKKVEEKKTSLESEKQDLEDLKSQAEEEQSKVSGLISQTSSSINAYSDQIGNAEANADALQDQLDQQNSQIDALEKQLAEEKRLESLSAQSVWRNISDVTFQDGDRYLLANLIYCEAGNQPYEGQVAVGAVVINRVLSGAFPDTIVGVIYQSWQFEPVSTGRLALALARDDATDACYQAADAAMAGQTTVSDCIFFRTPIPQVTPRYTIGGHIFY